MKQSFEGLPAAPGIGIGKLHIYQPAHFQLETQVLTYTADPDAAWQQFLTAKAEVDFELRKLGEDENSLVAEVFTAQRAILQDHTLAELVHAAIFEKHLSVLSATQSAIRHMADIFRNLSDEYFAGRFVDVIDIGNRLLVQMGGQTAAGDLLRELPPQTILVSTTLTPSELTQLPRENVKGIALAESTPTAHSAILARTLGIPMVCTMGKAILRLPSTEAIVDGDTGELLVVPSSGELVLYKETQQLQVAQQAHALEQAQKQADTKDGIAITILANINHPEELTQLTAAGADGVGLLRTEYLFQNRLTPPTLDEQIEVYLKLAQQMQGRPLTVRALDAGGDKPMRYLHHAAESNPFLGLRGIRLLLAAPELLRIQFRALYRVAQELRDVLEIRFMLPMISCISEVVAARILLDDVIAEEQSKRVSEHPVKIGAMIEIPSAALVARRMADLVDFFSIGTNDLAQYTMATDRTNAGVAPLADPLHPAVLQLIQLTCMAGDAAQLPVSLCGEVSGDPRAIPLLLGLGLREVSAPLPAVPLVKEAVRTCNLADGRRLAALALECATAADVRKLL